MVLTSADQMGRCWGGLGGEKTWWSRVSLSWLGSRGLCAVATLSITIWQRNIGARGGEEIVEPRSGPGRQLAVHVIRRRACHDAVFGVGAMVGPDSTFVAVGADQDTSWRDDIPAEPGLAGVGNARAAV
jgi:hypothetical protein